ncbi:hypothetical protein BT96DRAFT_1000712 [Gymnopus androsaceus JB14]|uniref:Uncharacterized protein n=1 Tax=Gymnopus androsaceus JB14 TaxID=1447944 RepID=A0A6A4H337_9AGAR|nr:hypothetical protein BT96DRAFT_1000712 [Gymnopus androsaceus JB14]
MVSGLSGFGSGSGSSSSDEVSTPNAAAAGPTTPKAKATPSGSKPPVARKPKPNIKRGLHVSRLRVGFGKGSGRNTLFTPIEGEKPWVFLRVQVVGCTDLLAKDRNGFSDPLSQHY